MDTYSTVLSPVLLMTIELSLDEKLDPLDLLPLLDPLDDDRVSIDSEIVSPVLPPEFEMPGPPFDDCWRSSVSLCVHAPSARYVFVPGTRIATVRPVPSTPRPPRQLGAVSVGRRHRGIEASGEKQNCDRRLQLILGDGA